MMPAHRVVLLVAVLLIVGLGIAHAESPGDILSRSRYSEAVARQILEVFEGASEQNVPEDYLLPRLQEGISKRIPANRLVSALEQDVGWFVESRSLMLSVPGGPTLLSDHASWARTVTLLRIPLERTEVASLIRLADGRPSAYRGVSALYVRLKNWGIADAHAIAIAGAALESTIPTSDYEGLSDILVRGRQAGLPVDRLIERMILVLPVADRVRTVERALLD